MKNITLVSSIFAILLLNSCGDRALKVQEGTTDPCVTITAPTCDRDADGLTNAQEATIGTDPTNPDTDGDGHTDGTGEELATPKTDPLNPCNPSENKGYKGYVKTNTIWQKADCDKDGYLNGSEDNVSHIPNYISDPYDPFSACFPVGINADKTIKNTYCEIHAEDGRIWIDRDLGAGGICTASNDTNCNGWLFQWGRSTDGHQLRTSSSVDLNPATFSDASDTFEEASKGFFDWLVGISMDEFTYGDINTRKTNWTSTTNNTVCRTGWYVPSQAEFLKLAIDGNITDATSAFNSKLKFGTTGARTSLGGGFYAEGTTGYLWTSDSNETTAVAFTYGVAKSNAPWTYSGRASGYGVRCIKK